MIDISWEVTYFDCKNMGGNDDGETVPQTRPSVGASYTSGNMRDFIFRTQNDNLSLVLFEYHDILKGVELYLKCNLF